MVACDSCDGWYHPDCVGLPEEETDAVTNFKCVTN
jgi:hypothetical protein